MAEENKNWSLASKVIFIAAAASCFTAYVSPPIALLIGLIIAQTTGHPFMQYNHKATQMLLQFSVVGLGFGMNVVAALQTGKDGIMFSTASILGTLGLGYLLGRALKIERKTSHLISSGTAICGGSAIAAISKVLNSDERETSVALGTVFILNSIALFLFPAVGHALNLSQRQFGIWSAIAIHDTSSVVGAASKYGDQALQIATTVKLVRALWIAPLAIATSFMFRSRPSKVKFPMFILFFILAMIVGTYVPFIQPVVPYLTDAAKKGLTLTLFLIGAGSSYKVMKSVGFRPMLQGVILWVCISLAALWAVEVIF
ncbi:MAG TPA: putative sulfate exporter family transporter [Bacteroidia bacterium]|jgi:uncharacterized integral membrane protein (TIGR00698 family)|nr:putative sulfate exporter family transporter [Bacteroidia bacterium]